METAHNSDIFHGIILKSMRLVITDIISKVEESPEIYLKKKNCKDDDDKEALIIDEYAEDFFRDVICEKLPDIEIYGEENPILDLDLSNKQDLCVLVDMVDGTDLLERGLSNWCSSAVFFNPQRPSGEKIIAAFIATPEKEIYFSTSTAKNVYVQNSKEEIRIVAGKSDITTLSQSSICFYGQKGGRLFDIVNTNLFKLYAQPECKDARIYNLAGMPMMVKLIDKRVKNAKGIDVIVEKRGQKPHDFVPGAFLVKKAGGILIDRDTHKEMTYSEIEERLLLPFAEKSNTKYVMAANQELANKVHQLLD